MERTFKFNNWFVVVLTLSLLAPSFFAQSPQAFANTRSSYIVFGIPNDQVTYLRVVGNNQYDTEAVWSKTFPSPGTTLAVTANGNTYWWWNGTIVITFTSRNLGTRTCIIDNLNTYGGGSMGVSYTPGAGCSGDTGSARSSRRAVEEMSNYMARDKAYQVLDLASAANDAVGCASGIAMGLAGTVRVMTIVECGGVTLYAVNKINELISATGKFLNVPGVSNSSSTCTQVLSNAGFESGSSSWSQSSSGGFQLIETDSPRSGSLSAYLGGYDDATEYVYQQVAIPGDARSVGLSYWWYMSTEEDSSTAYDYMRVRVLNTGGSVLGTVSTVSNTSPSDRWNQSQVDLSAYKGQTIRIQWYAITDESLSTRFFVDDTGLNVCR